MSKRRERSRLSDRGRSRALRTWGLYLLALTAWVTVVLLLAFLGYLVCSAVTWYDPLNPIYLFLNWVRDYFFFVCALVVLAGWTVISYFFIARPVGQVEAMAQAAEQLAVPGEEPIRLPDGLGDAEVQLNAAREAALRNARAAKEAEQRKNDLVVYMAHDLKTPLTSVIGYLTLLRDEPQLSPELRARYTGIALDKAERLEDLINEFFDITRFEFQPMLAEADLTCRLDLPERLPCPCDGEKLSRVFDNLLRNASHYSLPGTEVRIAGSSDGQTITLTFTNAGRTIPQEKLDRIFDQFFRLDSARASRTGGAGLGLAIAKEIVELHGGTIRAESAADTVTFTVTLPAL